MQVVILAAGRGSRLGAKADGLPKCLLQIGGRPLIEHQLRALADIGGGPVLAVIGYAADLVRDTLGDRAETIFNARYDGTNSMYSLWLAREWIKGPVIIMNSDLLCDREVFDLLARAGPDHLVYDSSSGRAAEHMKVRIADARVVDISKTMSGGESCGENLGMVYLSEPSARAVLGAASETIAGGDVNSFWVAALRATLDRVPIRGLDVAGVPWVEIDTPYDLDRARHTVWPQIMDRTATILVRRRRKHRVKLMLLAGVLLALLAGVWFVARHFAERNWESVAADSGRHRTLVVDNVPQEWCEARGNDAITTRIAGPRLLRIDARCLVASGTATRVPYVVELLVDGRRFDWYKFSATPDPRIAVAGVVVCDRDKIELPVPTGDHEVGVRLVVGDAVGLLARFKVLDPKP